jgi:hypothetical protein
MAIEGSRQLLANAASSTDVCGTSCRLHLLALTYYIKECNIAASKHREAVGN